MSAAICTSGLTLRDPRQTLRASAGRVRLRADLVIPEPWTAIDPPVHGMRVVIDAVGGGVTLDATLPGGAAWSRHGTRAVYRDPAGSVGGVVRAIVRDRRAREPGALRIVVKARGGSLVLPDAADVRTTLVLGTANECAALVWNGPQGSPPRCRGDARRLVCR